jgi:hypothetical protein
MSALEYETAMTLSTHGFYVLELEPVYRSYDRDGVLCID